jgi:hypothetical protein
MLTNKQIAAIILSIACATNLVSATPSETPSDKVFTFPEKNFETPEAAIKHFVERLAANDLAGAFEACVINEGDSINYEAYYKNKKIMSPLLSLSSSQYPIFAQINRISILASLSHQVKMMLYSLTSDINIEELMNLDEKKILSFIDSSDPRKISGLTIVKMKLPAAIMNSDEARKEAMEWAKSYGADDSTERIVLYKLNETYYWGGIYLLKYGKYWRIYSLYSNYAGNRLGNLTKLSSASDEFDKMGK